MKQRAGKKMMFLLLRLHFLHSFTEMFPEMFPYLMWLDQHVQGTDISTNMTSNFDVENQENAKESDGISTTYRFSLVTVISLLSQGEKNAQKRKKSQIRKSISIFLCSW